MDINVIELKRKIVESKRNDKDNQMKYCDMLLKHALKEGNDENIAYAYLWMADYSYYVKRDMNSLDSYLNKAKAHLSMEPSYNLIIYYTLKAMNNDATYDLLSRLDAYLEIIYNGKMIGDEVNVVIANGNIAELFHLCRDYQTALAYGITVYEQYKKLPNARDVNKTILLANIVECSCYVNDANHALYYIEELEKIPQTFVYYKIYLNICYLRYYSMKPMAADALQIERVLLHQLKYEDANRDTKYECFMIMVEAMLTIRAAQEMEELIIYMESIFNESDANRWLQIQKMRIAYYTLMNDKSALAKQYQIYVKTYARVEKANQETNIKGVRATIEIQNIKRQEKTLLENNRSLETESMIDVMTKLYNRRYFNAILTKLQQEKTLEHLGFSIFDVDYFKEYNDTYGHIKGDQVLIKVGQILRNTKDNRITPCRFGGDEFICVFANMSDEEIGDYIISVMKQLKETAIPHVSSKCTAIVTLSIGYGMENVNKDFNQDQLLERIDQALYESKRKGRNMCTKIRMAGDSFE